MLYYANATDPVKWKGYVNSTPLHAACKNSHIEIVKLLIEKGADIGVQYVFSCMVVILYIASLWLPSRKNLHG